jgi:hypothetical protein
MTMLRAILRVILPLIATGIITLINFYMFPILPLIVIISFWCLSFLGAIVQYLGTDWGWR